MPLGDTKSGGGEFNAGFAENDACLLAEGRDWGGGGPSARAGPTCEWIEGRFC